MKQIDDWGENFRREFFYLKEFSSDDWDTEETNIEEVLLEIMENIKEVWLKISLFVCVH